MAARRSGLSVRLVLVAAIAIGMVVSSVAAYQQAPHGSDGILFGFYGGGITREPATETMVQVSIMHTCAFDDGLILEKVEIYGESEIPVKSFAVNMTLNSVFWKKIPLDALGMLIERIPIVGYVILTMVGQEAAKLAAAIRAESFSTGYFTIDLRQIKQPLTSGNITVVAKATLVHNGERVTLEREVIVEYGGPLT
jgi:hypothetical protein